MSKIDADLAAALAVRDWTNPLRTGRKLWKGRTWAVTAQGIERYRGAWYMIDANRLGERHGGILDWPRHIAQKPLEYDFEDFARAFVVGLRLHRDAYGGVPATELLTASFEAAWEKHRSRLGDSLRNLWERQPGVSDVKAWTPAALAGATFPKGFEFGPEGADQDEALGVYGPVRPYTISSGRKAGAPPAGGTADHG